MAFGQDANTSLFLKAVANSVLPAPAGQGAITADPSEALLVADALSYDMFRQLQKLLEEMGSPAASSPVGRGCPS